MTLRVIIQIVPHGDEGRRFNIHTFNISNTGEHPLLGKPNFCVYQVEQIDHTVPGIESEYYDWMEQVVHNTEQGAIQLVWNVLGQADIVQKRKQRLPKAKGTVPLKKVLERRSPEERKRIEKQAKKLIAKEQRKRAKK